MLDRLRPGRLLDAVPAVVATLLMVVAIASTVRGLDFVDESYFLSLIADPGANRDNGELFLFGFLVHPVYAALGHDVALLRIANLLVMGGVAAWMAHVVLSEVRSLRPSTRRASPGHLVAVSVVVASVVSAYAGGVRVPNYRTVDLVGLMLLTLAFVWTTQGHQFRAGLLMGSAWWLSVVGRPPTAVVLVVIIPVLLMVMRALTLRLVAAALVGATAAATLTLVVARMSPCETVAYLVRGYRQNQLIGGHTSIRGLVGLVNPEWGGFVVFGLPVLLMAVVVTLVLHRRDRLPPVAVRAAALAFGILALGVVLAAPMLVAQGRPSAVLPMALVIPVWTVGLLLMEDRTERGSPRREPPMLFVVMPLLAAPYVASVGTNSPFTHTMALASTFWVLAAMVVTTCSQTETPVARGVGLVTAGLCLAVPAAVLAVLAGEVELEPGAPPAREATIAGGTLLMTPPDADVLDLLRGVAAKEGLTSRTPVVDLTGVGAGYRFQLGPHPFGRAFLFGIFPGATEGARYSFSWESCEERSRTWVIYADNNPWDVSPAFTQGVLSLETDYKRVATFSPTQGPEEWRGLRMHVLKPTPAVARKLGC